jgi:hypothetical protein
MSRSRERSHKINNRAYVAIDFEAIEGDLWWSLAFILAEYPSGRVLERHEFFCDRSSHCITSTDTQHFWTRNKKAFDYTTHHANGVTVLEAERQVTLFVQDLKRRLPVFFLVTDSPAFDVRLLDGILARNGEPPVSVRGYNIHRQAFCSWSYAVCVAHTLGIRVKDIQQSPIAMYTKLSRAPREVEKTDQGVCRHVSLFDCHTILANYFMLLDITTELAAVRRYE